MNAQDLKAYQHLNLSAEIEGASPHRLIQLLLNGALEKIQRAIYCFSVADLVEANKQITWAISIVGGLQMSLDKSILSPITTNLDSLYDYISHRLLAAQVQKNPSFLEEVKNLLLEIKSAWDQIPPNEQNAHQRREAYLDKNT